MKVVDLKVFDAEGGNGWIVETPPGMRNYSLWDNRWFWHGNIHNCFPCTSKENGLKQCQNHFQTIINGCLQSTR